MRALDENELKALRLFANGRTADEMAIALIRAVRKAGGTPFSQVQRARVSRAASSSLACISCGSASRRSSSGWVKTRRDSKNVHFIQLNDGSSATDLKVVLDEGIVAALDWHAGGDTGGGGAG